MLPVQHPQSLRGLVDAGVLHHLDVLALGDDVRAVAAHGQG